MSNSLPEIPGYQLDQRLLQHPLAELWHGRTFTGMEIVALVLSEAGARDASVRDRLVSASRTAALEPGRLETPLWAANFNSERPYAVTQLIPGQSGAERLLDPLDGILGNDDESVQAVRAQFSQYGAMPPAADQLPSYVDHPQSSPATQQPNPAAPQPEQPIQPEQPAAVGVAGRLGKGVYVVAAVIVLIVFTVTYSVGTAIGSAVKDDPTAAPPAAAVSPSGYPTPVLLPAIPKITTAPYKRPDGSPGVVGATYAADADLQVITNAELPFALGWPRPPEVVFLGESSTMVYRRILTHSDFVKGGLKGSLDARIALHPCASLAGCLADRASFDQQWTKVYKTVAPTTAKDGRTWLTVHAQAPYAVMMTRAYESGGRWWLVGAAVTSATPGEEPDVQRILNDIWRQTS
ncbi:hypothetical protein [Kribbella sp. NPDC055071]